MRGYVRIVLMLLLTISLLGCFLYIVLVFDPFNWGSMRSSRFTWEKFSTIKEGDEINKVIASLGAPIEAPENFSIILGSPSDPCSSGHCKKYLFAGAAWGASFKEAIVIVDSTGHVVHAEARQE
jgi:hypothetical protein